MLLYDAKKTVEGARTKKERHAWKGLDSGDANPKMYSRCLCLVFELSHAVVVKFASQVLAKRGGRITVVCLFAYRTGPRAGRMQ